MIVKSLNTGDLFFRLIAAAAVDVGHGHEIDARDRANLPEQIVAAIAHADHAHPDAVVCAQHGGSWIRQHGSRSHRGLLQKSAPALVKRKDVGHSSLLVNPEITLRPPVAQASSFPT